MTDIKEVTIKVNSKVIDLNPFSRLIIGNTIEALIKSLRMEEEPKIIEITLTK
jgi:hypothetical protein